MASPLTIHFIQYLCTPKNDTWLFNSRFGPLPNLRFQSCKGPLNCGSFTSTGLNSEFKSKNNICVMDKLSFTTQLCKFFYYSGNIFINSNKFLICIPN